MIELLLFTLGGCLLGVFTGLVPGIHVNLVSIILVGVLTSFNPCLIAVMIIAMAITHTFLDFCPGILLGAPEPSTALSVLPGHRMLLNRRGAEAIFLTMVGGVGAVFACMALFPFFLFAIPYLYQNIEGGICWILLVIAGVMIMTSPYFRGKAISLFVFMVSGMLGVILFDSYMVSSQLVLFPAFTGLFGISTLIISLRKRAEIPKQYMESLSVPNRLALSGILKGLFSGVLVGTLPGVGAAQATVLAQQVTRRGDEKEFLVSIGAINTIVALFSLISLYTISRARSGAAIAVQGVLPLFGFNDLLLLVAAALIAAGFSVFVMLGVTRGMVNMMHRFNYQKMTMFIISLLVVLVFLFTGAVGGLILFVSTAIGLLAPLLGVKRSNLMGVLMVPLIIYYLPL